MSIILLRAITSSNGATFPPCSASSLTADHCGDTNQMNTPGYTAILFASYDVLRDGVLGLKEAIVPASSFAGCVPTRRCPNTSGTTVLRPGSGCISSSECLDQDLETVCLNNDENSDAHQK